ncbi:MAG: NADH-quinone oxidoreductase subunit L [Pyrinomonadaceae bacterium]|nr:NADH-quinone oxidoreductase subunit L [Sphingobacteriaceae bacterium]
MEAFTQIDLSLLAVIAVFLPFLSFLGISLISGKNNRGTVVSISAISLSFLISIVLFLQVWNTQSIHQQLHWFTIGTTGFKVGVLLNNLSVLMMVLISAISLLVHVYSTKYMEGDNYLYRYWAYLGLFCFSMLGLVITDNLLLLYMFWELVGFSSYLLIGFWFTKVTAAKAAKKAFIMNRLGDLGFITGIMIVFSQFNTLDISLLFDQAGLVSQSYIENATWINGTHAMPAIWLTVAGLAFFFGAIAKSAQFPLHTWLPDAMAGPTSVSSLIHAETMVAAGVFLLARVYPIFDSTVLLIIASIGAFTAFMAATIALNQNDIKRILAFSTISQLGFMMIAMGVGAYTAGIFHLLTHAFFKCLLFLAAGAVIHELAHLKHKNALDFDHQSILNMGGLKKRMPITFLTMLLASLALAGIPFTSGFLSKDAILIQSFDWARGQNSWAMLIPCSAFLTSLFTAFYIARLIFKVFFGKFRLEKQFNRKLSIHEAPAAMKYVMLVLAVFCLFPVFSLNPFGYQSSWIFSGFPLKTSLQHSAYHIIIPISVSILSIAVIYGAGIWYLKRNAHLSSNPITRFTANKWHFDAIYKFAFTDSITSLSQFVFWFDRTVIDGFVNKLAKTGVLLSKIIHWIDAYIVDGFINGVASAAKTIGNFARHFQTGRLQHYLLTMVIMVLTFFLIKYFSQAI